ncbi:ATP-binding protein [Spirulina sp. CS-785/01]|uniref:AAA family ATPase n=1 Tax=Spirulina sp. CS-785/01 TaxID=3021716 RepID=UPI00232B9829|nr:ATP-binding protein [Spirulina sp. CS-785/01]MDB9315808.1 ATP-binding protein [Spirulina sp. CS-785/01]
MIKYFTVKNFRSIKEEVILEGDLKIKKESPFTVNPIIGIVGANASGKTCLLQALTFVLWFMQNSFFRLEEHDNIPCDPFITQPDLPIEFHLIFTKRVNFERFKQLGINGEAFKKAIDFEYKLIIVAEKVIKEELYYYPKNRQREVYIRQDNEIKFGNSIKPLDKESLQNLRKNSSLISFASLYSTQIIAQECKNYSFQSNINYRGLTEYKFNSAIREYLAENIDREKIKNLLNIADIGIEDFTLVEQSQELMQNAQELVSDLSDLDEAEKTIPLQEEEKELQEIREMANKLTEKLKNLTPSELVKKSKSHTSKKILFNHKIEQTTRALEAENESSGTLQFLIVLNQVLSALKNGTVLILDEVEIKLHQNLIAYLLGLFQNPIENPYNAQIICSFHNTALIKLLQPQQLWFTEKNEQGFTELFSATDFTDIKKLYERDLEELYRIGRFGAKPRGI